jgi:hypothetical protein
LVRCVDCKFFIEIPDPQTEKFKEEYVKRWGHLPRGGYYSMWISRIKDGKCIKPLYKNKKFKNSAWYYERKCFVFKEGNLGAEKVG